MRKKFLGAIMLGLLALGTTSTITSCKDYDGDISSLKNDIAANKTAITTATTQLQSEIASLKNSLETVQSTLAAKANQTDLDAEITRAKGEEAALKSKIESAEATLIQLQNLVNGKVDQTDFDTAIQGIYARLEALEKGLGTALTDIESLKDGLANEETARKAADENLQIQIDALNKFKESANADITTLKEQMEAAQKAIADNSTSISDLTKKMNDLSELVAKYNSQLDVLVVLVENSLRSMVFVPDFYYEGIEATQLKTMNYSYYTLQPVDADKDGEFNLTAATGKADATSENHFRYNTTDAFTVLNSVVRYHLNPSSADLTDAEYNILTADKDYVIGRAGATVQLTANDPKVENGDLVYTLGVDKPELIKTIKDDQMVTVFATETTLPKKSNASEKYTVTSDYAAVTATAVNGGYILSNVCKAVGNETIDATTAERVTMTGVVNNNACGKCDVVDKLHMFRTFEEAAYPQGKNVMPTTDAQATVAWNSTLDLRRLVETHYAATDEPVTVEDLAANNLTYKFEIVGSIYGSNLTSEGAHALIMEDGYTLHPQMPTTDGKQNKSVGEQSKTTIDRQPVIRVSLVDTKKNEVLDYGYIRIRIAAVDEPVDKKADKYVPYTGSTYTYNVNDGCKMDAWNPYNWSNTWNQVEYDLYHMLGISKETFDSHYTAETASAAGKTYAGLAQYEATAVTGGYSFALATNNIGTMNESVNPGTSETTTLKWTITAADMETAVGTTPGTKTFGRAVKYASDDKTTYPDVYVWVTTGTITVTKVAPSYGTFSGLDNAKIAEYWYAHNSNKVQGKAESRINVYSPEDQKVASLAGQPFETVLASEFVGNKIDAASMITVVDNTTDQSWATSKLSYDLQFDQSNVGRQFKGQTGAVYTMGVSADGKTLTATSGTTTQAVAVLSGNTVNTTKVNYQHTTYAEDLLNYKKYDQMTDDFLLATIGIIVKNECGQTLNVTDNTFDERFVRPLNVSDSGKSIKDAATSKQVINLKELVTMTDWRGQWNPATIDYWTYYNVKSITVRGASAGSSINNLITTNMNGGTIGTTKLSDVSDLVEFTYSPVTPATPSATANYGTITYTNNSQNVQTFAVQIPVRVSYEWGHIDTYVTVNVQETLGAKKK